jgi:RNA polymerase sigma-70 factor (ECF subfamily)
VTTRAEEAELLARVVNGDHDAFTALMRAHEDRVFSVCLRIMGDRERALDATQETFLTIFRKAGQFQGKSALGTWIYRIAVNRCYDELRKAKRERTDPLHDYVDPADPAADDELAAAGLRPGLRSALLSLPAEFRAAVVLSDIEGLSVAEAAEALGVPEGTVKSRVFRGRRMLAVRLGNQMGDESIKEV